MLYLSCALISYCHKSRQYIATTLGRAEIRVYWIRDGITINYGLPTVYIHPHMQCFPSPVHAKFYLQSYWLHSRNDTNFHIHIPPSSNRHLSNPFDWGTEYINKTIQTTEYRHISVSFLPHVRQTPRTKKHGNTHGGEQGNIPFRPSINFHPTLNIPPVWKSPP